MKNLKGLLLSFLWAANCEQCKRNGEKAIPILHLGEALFILNSKRGLEAERLFLKPKRKLCSGHCPREVL